MESVRARLFQEDIVTKLLKVCDHFGVYILRY